MPSRFSGRSGRNIHAETGASRGDGIGEWWSAIAVIALAALAIVSLTGSLEPVAGKLVSDRIPEILASLEPAERSLDAVQSAFRSLCQEPVLLALEFQPDCESGVILLPDDLFNGYGSADLGAGAKEDLGAAMTIYLSRLRGLPALWDSLEAIEIRGHADPRALRNPYLTNMVGSQQRPLGVLFFLVGPEGLSKADQEDLQRLAVVSGVSFARPPATCPNDSRECYAEWRRVEIRPVLSEPLRRSDWSRTVQDVRNAAARAQRESATQ
jgi:outer membrane protein OmpA-like peptidoglycan-associated protein